LDVLDVIEKYGELGQQEEEKASLGNSAPQKR
jgi:hypothetical protein